jgi:hypothetical protein
MVNVGIAGIPRMFPGHKQTIVNGSNIQTGVVPFIETDTVGHGYPDATPIVPPQGSASGAVVNTTPQMKQGILPRHNTPDKPTERGGKVAMRLVNGVYSPIVEYTPPEIQP